MYIYILYLYGLALHIRALPNRKYETDTRMNLFFFFFVACAASLMNFITTHHILLALSCKRLDVQTHDKFNDSSPFFQRFYFCLKTNVKTLQLIMVLMLVSQAPFVDHLYTWKKSTKIVNNSTWNFYPHCIWSLTSTYSIQVSLR